MRGLLRECRALAAYVGRDYAAGLVDGVSVGHTIFERELEGQAAIMFEATRHRGVDATERPYVTYTLEGNATKKIRLADMSKEILALALEEYDLEALAQADEDGELVVEHGVDYFVDARQGRLETTSLVTYYLDEEQIVSQGYNSEEENHDLSGTLDEESQVIWHHAPVPVHQEAIGDPSDRTLAHSLFDEIVVSRSGEQLEEFYRREQIRRALGMISVLKWNLRISS